MTIELDDKASQDLHLLREALGGVSMRHAIRFAVIETAELARLIRQGATIYAVPPEGEGPDTVLLLNQLRPAREARDE